MGKASYDMQCSICHGPTGAGIIPAYAINLENGLGSTNLPASGLVQYIHDNMPPAPNSANCVDECAENVAAYIWSWDDGFELTSVATCTEGTAPGAGTTTVFEDQGEVQGSLTGWSKIAMSPDEFTNVALETNNALYAVPKPATADDTCDGASTIRTVLVKKYGDYDNQHANGIEVSLASESRMFSGVESIELEFKINSQHTSLPSAEYLAARYPQLSEAQIAQLDSGKVNLAVSLIGPRPSGGNVTAQAERYIEIDPVNFDQWLKVTIPFEDMNLYTVSSWTKTLSDISTLGTAVIQVIQINPEIYGNRRSPAQINTFGNVVRNLDETFDPITENKNETFKEIDITFKKVEVNWK